MDVIKLKGYQNALSHRVGDMDLELHDPMIFPAHFMSMVYLQYVWVRDDNGESIKKNAK